MRVKDLKGIEKNFLVSWEDWDEFDFFTPVFCNVELRVDVFGSIIADKFNGGELVLLTNKNTIELYSKDDEVVQYRMNITLSPKE